MNFSKIKIMLKKTNSIFLVAVFNNRFVVGWLQKGTFDIIALIQMFHLLSTPNYLPAAMTASAVIVSGNPGGGSQSGKTFLISIWAYWAVSGDYIPSAALLQYTLTTDFGSSIWDMAYPNLKNYHGD
jgi:hypothetical protein